MNQIKCQSPVLLRVTFYQDETTLDKSIMMGIMEKHIKQERQGQEMLISIGRPL